MHKDRIYCLKIEVRVLVYLRIRPVGCHKIQDPWGPIIYRVVGIMENTYTVEPLERESTKTVNRVDIWPCVYQPTPTPRRMPKAQEEKSKSISEVES